MTALPQILAAWFGGACMLGALGCVPQGTNASSVTVHPGLSVPYVVGDPVENPPVRALFARSPWLVVDPGSDAGLHRPIPKAGPTVLGRVVDGSRDNLTTIRALQELVDDADAGLGEPVAVDRNDLQSLGIVAPTEHLWLLGTDGPCRAGVGQPMLTVYGNPANLYEVSWELLGCHGTVWAPVGLIAEQLPSDVRWAPAETIVDVQGSAAEPWDNVLDDLANQPPWDGAGPDSRIVWAQGIPSLSPSPTTVLYSLWNAGTPEQPCAQQEETAVTHALWDDASFEAVTPLPEVEHPVVLLGAIAQKGRPEALVYRDGLHGWVAVPPAPTAEELRAEEREQEAQDVERGIAAGPKTWTAIELQTGVYASLDQQAASYSVRTPDCPAS